MKPKRDPYKRPKPAAARCGRDPDRFATASTTLLSDGRTARAAGRARSRGRIGSGRRWRAGCKAGAGPAQRGCPPHWRSLPKVNGGSDKSPAVELYYEDHGAGKPVVLIHGWPPGG